MVLNGAEKYQMVQTGTKWGWMVPNDAEWFQILLNDLKWYGMSVGWLNADKAGKLIKANFAILSTLIWLYASSSTSYLLYNTCMLPSVSF